MKERPNYAVVQLVLDKRDARVILRALRTFANKKSASEMNRLSANEMIEKIEQYAKDLGVK